MRGLLPSSYGDAFADVYDDWYHDIGDVPATVELLADLAGPDGDVLELGVGTGRIACALARSVRSVVGVDASERMLERLATNDSDGRVHALLGDMVDDLPPGPFHLVVVAYNTFFNLLTAERQQGCFEAVAQRLRPGGRFVVEAFVPAATETQRSTQLTVRSLEADRVVLSASLHDAATQSAEGHFIEITEQGGVRLRPWAIRWATPDELDRMAIQAGLQLEHRWADVDRSEFGPASDRHLSIYRAPA